MTLAGMPPALDEDGVIERVTSRLCSMKGLDAQGYRLSSLGRASAAGRSSEAVAF
jgi:hypothetical protein